LGIKRWPKAAPALSSVSSWLVRGALSIEPPACGAPAAGGVQRRGAPLRRPRCARARGRVYGNQGGPGSEVRVVGRRIVIRPLCVSI